MHEYSTKPCTKCGVPKPLSEFHVDRKTPDGHGFRCKSCVNTGPRQPGTYYVNDSGLCRICGRGEPDVQFGIDRQRIFGISTICKECKSAEAKRYGAVYREQIQAKNAARVQRIRLDVLLHYGGMPPMCACCGESHLEFLAIDHIGGGGGKHRSDIGKPAGHKFACWLRDQGYPPGYRIACHSCNHATKDGYPCVHEDPFWTKDLSALTHRQAYSHNYAKNRRLTILKHYGGNPPSCACCGESHVRFLSIDHIKGGGYRHMKEVRRPLDWIIFHDGFPPDYRILCMNCNLARGFYGRCPHEASTDHRMTNLSSNVMQH